MFSFKHFWLYAIGIFILLLALIGTVIWQSAEAPAVAVKKELQNKLQDGTTSFPSGLNANSDSQFEKLPAPAKKLAKLLEESAQAPVDQNELEKRMRALDKQLADLKQQMATKGIQTPDEAVTSSPSSPEDSDIEARLQAIESHLRSTSTPN